MSLLRTELLELTCNWKICNGKELISCITFVRGEEVDFDDLVTLESCICLSREGFNHTDLPEITFKAKTDGIVISNLYISSEARLLELYGRCGEYQNTTKADDSLAGDEDMKVYNAKLTLPHHSPDCSVRFAGLGAGKTEMWILGIGVVLRPSSPTASMAARVDQLLLGFAVPLSASAEECKKLVMAQAAIPQSSQGSSSYGGAEEQRIKQYVDVCCEKLETKLMQQIDLKFESLQVSINNKLDEISSSLKKD